MIFRILLYYWDYLLDFHDLQNSVDAVHESFAQRKPFVGESRTSSTLHPELTYRSTSIKF